jgi:hypothetical protein
MSSRGNKLKRNTMIIDFLNISTNGKCFNLESNEWYFIFVCFSDFRYIPSCIPKCSSSESYALIKSSCLEKITFTEILKYLQNNLKSTFFINLVWKILLNLL